MEENIQPTEENNNASGNDVAMVNDLYKTWFLDYASYVILERAVPAVEDGLKPVQRRIQHSMKEMDDGRFNKVANVIGQTMQYHPHGDASISEAIVGLGQKDLMIETQGNWGDVRTGDDAAAARYIEARLSKFALEIAFNAKTTQWQLSYDGRKREPVALPMKFPLLLAQGVEGIAVGLATKVLPHNFCELIQASIQYLKGRKFEIYPDFLTGGMIDVSNYNDGKRGGKVRVRARIVEFDKKTLLIKDVPFGVTTTSLMDSIVKANDSGKIKIKKIIDNTAKDVEIEVQLAPGISPDVTIDALYAFTDCEISISPNACVIVGDKPMFIGVSELLKISTDETMTLLGRELEIKLQELEESWMASSLEKIFIEKKIYRDIEDAESWEEVLSVIEKGLEPYIKKFKRAITRDDIVALTEIKIKRISKYDKKKADELIQGIEADIEQTEHDIVHLRDFAINYFENLLKKFGKGRERRTEIRTFDTIQVTAVAQANVKLYVNWSEGFIGTSLKKDEFAFDCSDLDNVIIFRKDGKMMVTKVAEKTFVGKDIIHIEIFKKNDERTTYNMAYVDGASGVAYVKRFQAGGVTRDKEYDLTKGDPKSKVLYFSSNANGEAEKVNVVLKPTANARIKVFDYDFTELEIKGRSSAGNQLTKYPVHKITFKEKGESTLSGIKIWFDAEVGRLNTDSKGQYLGSFSGEDRILAIYKDGNYEITNYELTNRYESKDVVSVEKFNPECIVSCLYFDADQKNYNMKRFKIETTTLGSKFLFIKEGEGNKLLLATTHPHPKVRLKVGKKKSDAVEYVSDLKLTCEIKGWRTVGTKVASDVLSAEWAMDVPQALPKTGELF
ncbi:MAG: DNA gyrase/topoisomerase IV subunit A [Chitinophagales bacterium]|nr:DNA gyrase/topoisomerase IV subunit A [Chitinophagales bacterium]